jgi:hypothetical protein
MMMERGDCVCVFVCEKRQVDVLFVYSNHSVNNRNVLPVKLENADVAHFDRPIVHPKKEEIATIESRLHASTGCSYMRPTIQG